MEAHSFIGISAAETNQKLSFLLPHSCAFLKKLWEICKFLEFCAFIKVEMTDMLDVVLILCKNNIVKSWRHCQKDTSTVVKFLNWNGLNEKVCDK